MKKVVYFKAGRALVIHKPTSEQMEKIKLFPHLIDPDESEVKDIPVSEWRIKDGKLVSATKIKIVYVNKVIDRPVEVIKDRIVYKTDTPIIIVAFAMGMIISGCIVMINQMFF